MDLAKLRVDLAQPDASANTVALVKLLSEIGPDIAEIARRLGQHKESVRYRYNEKLVKHGFQIKADLRYGALGLTRVVMKLRVGGAYLEHARELFEAMSELCYIATYAATMPGDVCIVNGAVPKEFTAEFHRFMQDLKEKGILSEVEFFDCDWFRVAPMRAECFDFDEGVWDFDWSNPPPVDEKAARDTVSERKRIDRVDLLLLKELRMDSDRSLREIQAAIKKVNGLDINYKTLGWHYKQHVLGQRLIRGYAVGWHRMKYSFGREKIERFGRHEYLGVSLIVRGASEQERVMLRSKLNRLPFLWCEAAGEAYYSQLFFPLDMVNEAFEYLKELLRPYGTRAEVFLVDPAESVSYTIGYKLWDEQRRRWTFDRTAMLARLESSLLKIKEQSA